MTNTSLFRPSRGCRMDKLCQLTGSALISQAGFCLKMAGKASAILRTLQNTPDVRFLDEIPRYQAANTAPVAAVQPETQWRHRVAQHDLVRPRHMTSRHIEKRGGAVIP